MRPTDFAAATGLSPKALRLYDERGLLRPARVDPTSGYRRYDPDQVVTAGRIALLRQAGVGLGDIARFLAEPRAETITTWSSMIAQEAAQRQRALEALARSLGLTHTEPKEAVMTVTIRSVTSREELEAVYDLLGAKFDPATDHTDEHRFLELAAAFPAQAGLLLVAEEAGSAVGGALGFLGSEGNATLRILAIVETRRRAGIGRSLLRAFEAGVANLGGIRVSLGADQEAGFYLRHGYETLLLLQWVHDPSRFEAEVTMLQNGP